MLAEEINIFTMDVLSNWSTKGGDPGEVSGLPGHVQCREGHHLDTQPVAPMSTLPLTLTQQNCFQTHLTLPDEPGGI